MNREFLVPAWHEADANLVFDDRGDACEHGLEPFYAAESIIRANDGSARARFDLDGRDYVATLYYQNSGIGALNHYSCDLSTIREFRIKWECVEDGDDVGERSGGIHLAPRTPYMVDSDGESISTPGDLVGVNCRVQGSNVPLPQYAELLHRATKALGFDARYFDPDRLHPEYSNIQDAARYVRIVRDESGPLHATEGALARVSKLLANDREGYRKHVANDTEVPGYYHTTTIGTKRASELVPQHHLAKEFKHYLPRDSESFDPEDPLYHPKVEVALQASRIDDHVRWGERDRVARELDEALVNVLAWEDFPVTDEQLAKSSLDGGPARGGRGPYVEDQYFEPVTERRQCRVVDDPTPDISDHQEHIVIKHLVDGLEDSDIDLLDVLVSDGGRIGPKDVAVETDWHLDTIYRAIERLDDLVEHSYDELSLHSHHVAQRVAEAVDHARTHAEDAATTLAKTLERETGMTIEGDFLVEWFDRWGVEVEDRREARLKLRFGRLPGVSIGDFKSILKDGRYAWLKSGWDPLRFNDADVIVKLDSGVHRARAGDLV